MDDAPEPDETDDAAYWREVLGDDEAADRILSDPKVRRAVESGNPETVFSSFASLRRSTRSRSEREALDAALSDRRAFLSAIRSAPSLGRLNGFGVGMYGGSEYDSENGTYIGTRYVSGFWVPLFPLDSWLVQNAEGGGWHFLGRVPITPEFRIWQMAACAVAAVLVVILAVAALYGVWHTPLHIVNGLDVGVQVAVDDRSVFVHPGGRVEIDVANGKVRITCTDAAGRVIESLERSVSSGHDAAIYNVLGAGMVYVDRIPYVVGEMSQEQIDALAHTSWFASQSWVALKDVDYAFRDPPAEVSVRKGHRVEHRTVAGIAGGSWRDAVDVAHEAYSPKAAAELAARVACASPSDAEVVRDALEIIGEYGEVESARAVVSAWIDAHPGDTAVERIAERLGKTPQAPEDSGR